MSLVEQFYVPEDLFFECSQNCFLLQYCKKYFFSYSCFLLKYWENSAAESFDTGAIFLVFLEYNQIERSIK